MNTTELKEQLAASNKNRIETMESATQTLRATAETLRTELIASAEKFSETLKAECAEAMQRMEEQASKSQRRWMLLGAGMVILLVGTLAGSWILSLKQHIPPTPSNPYLLTTEGKTWAAVKQGTTPVSFNGQQYFQVQPLDQKQAMQTNTNTQTKETNTPANLTPMEQALLDSWKASERTLTKRCEDLENLLKKLLDACEQGQTSYEAMRSQYQALSLEVQQLRRLANFLLNNRNGKNP